MSRMQKNAIEWSVFALSLALLVITVGYLAVSAMRHDDAPPDVVIAVGEAVQVTAGYRVPVVVRNEGHTTAEAVLVEVVLRDGQQQLARAELTFAFVPRSSQRRGWVVFDRDPRCCRIEARPVSFEEP